MRISGGAARGIPLVVPRGDAVRPATDRLRQAVFSSLGAHVAGASFLDLFAGSGAYGLEALSRGATGGVFVERDARAVGCLRRNLSAVCKSLGRDERGLTILNTDASDAPSGGAGPPDLIFIDPPYEVIDEAAPTLFQRLSERLAGRPDALVVFEMPGEVDLRCRDGRPSAASASSVRQPTAVFFRQTIPASP